MSKDIKTAHDFLLPQSFWDGHSEKDLKTMQHLLKNPIWQVKTNIFCNILTIGEKCPREFGVTAIFENLF